jgi:hypothetical protein
LSTLDPQIDSEWLVKLNAKPYDEELRNAYFAALDAANDPRGELARLEKQVSELDLGAPGRNAIKSRRNELRLAISVEWRDRFGFGTRPGRDKPFPWPEDTATRWLSIYEYIEEVRGVWLPEEAKPAFATHGSSVTAWEKLIEAVRKSNKDYCALFRDCISLHDVPGWSKLYSLMVAGEDDFHWSVEETRRGEEDPPVHGLNFDYNTGKFIPSTSTGGTNYSSFARVTDFVRVMFETYDDLGRGERFLYQGSKAPAKLYRGWGKITIRRPTGAELETAKFKGPSSDDPGELTAKQAIIYALCEMGIFDTPNEAAEAKGTLEAAGLADYDWTDLIYLLEMDWKLDVDPDVSYKMLTIDDLANRMPPLNEDDDEDEDEDENDE